MESKANRRSLRTIAQLLVSGGFTALVAAISSGLEPHVVGLILAASQVAVTWGQNFLEQKEIIPTIFPAPPPQDPQA